MGRPGQMPDPRPYSTSRAGDTAGCWFDEPDPADRRSWAVPAGQGTYLEIDLELLLRRPAGARAMDLPRKVDREDRAAWRCVCRVDCAALVSEQAGCDGESEACSADAAVAGGAGCQLEQVGKEVGRDAGTVVDDTDEGMAGIFAAGDVNFASAQRVTQRVVDTRTGL